MVQQAKTREMHLQDNPLMVTRVQASTEQSKAEFKPDKARAPGVTGRAARIRARTRPAQSIERKRLQLRRRKTLFRQVETRNAEGDTATPATQHSTPNVSSFGPEGGLGSPSVRSPTANPMLMSRSPTSALGVMGSMQASANRLGQNPMLKLAHGTEQAPMPHTPSQ